MGMNNLHVVIVVMMTTFRVDFCFFDGFGHIFSIVLFVLFLYCEEIIIGKMFLNVKGRLSLLLTGYDLMIGKKQCSS